MDNTVNYEVYIYNGSDGSGKTVIHQSTANKSAPHVISGKYHGILSQPDKFEFVIPYGNPGWDKIEGLNTKVRVVNIIDSSVLFIGRVMPHKNGMEDTGIFDGDVTCEGALGYLNDSHTRRWHYENQTPTQILQAWLDYHNSIVDDDRKIQLGTVEVTQPITIDTNFETILNAIITKLVNILGGDIRVQERNGALYLDYLKAQGSNNEVKIQLGQNMKSAIQEWDPSDVVTRLIPLGYGEGINQLGIVGVNNGVDYVEDADAKAKYGVIEGKYNNSEIQNANTLMQAGNTALQQNKQPKLLIDTSAIDRSVLKQYEIEKYGLGDTLHLLNSILKMDVYARATEVSFDITSPQDKDNVISTRPITLTNQIVDLKQRTESILNAPQGNTCIFPITKAENADADHPITFDLDIPKETININRVYINLHGRKYRAYEKGAAGGGGNTYTSSSGGGSTQTSSSSSSSTTSSGGSSATSSNAADWEGTGWEYNTSVNKNGIAVNDNFIPEDALHHTHITDIPSHSHGMAHTHNVVIPAHTHDVVIPIHTHDLIYGIFESTYPKNTKVKVNGIDIGVNYGDGTGEIDEYNIDITSHINVGNNKIEISTEQNGRIEAIVYSQIFIQSK